MVITVEKRKQENLDPFENSTFNPYTKPIATVNPGEIVSIHTWDAFGGVVKPGQTFQQAVDKGKVGALNPVTGPIYIRGASPGDTLKVEILEIELPHEGASSIIPGFGALEGWLNLNDPLTKICKIKNNIVYFHTKTHGVIEIEADPFIGTIGVAPSFEAIKTLAPGIHGGNMDCPDVKPGNTLYLPVFCDGALFGLGDVHAVQGDGEICGTAIEVSAKVNVKFEILKKSISCPRIESNTEMMVVGSARPLEDAARMSYKGLIELLVEEYGWDQSEAYMFSSLAVKARIAQIVDPLYTVVTKIDKKYLISSINDGDI